ncbi:MAG TPA: type II toxin-antitoxin system VapC family toxin [Mucilaginibacter sp.]|jgi:predicted nucleic acid-binding protein
MNGTDIFIDTNICIYLLNGDIVLAEILQGQSLYLSIITEMELYAYHGYNSSAIQVLNNFLQSVSIINIEEKVKINAIEIRKQAKLKLPDCIIAASAISYNLPLITADRGFKKVQHLDLILFENN